MKQWIQLVTRCWWQWRRVKVPPNSLPWSSREVSFSRRFWDNNLAFLSRRNYSQSIVVPQFNKLVETSEDRLDEFPGVIQSPLTGEEKQGIHLYQVDNWPASVETTLEDGTKCSPTDILPPVYATHGAPGSWWGGIGYEAGYGGMFAVMILKGKQFKVCPDDIVISERLDQDINEQVVSDRVLAIGTLEFSLFGRPYLPYARVTMTVEQQTLTSEVVSFRFKKRKRYRKAWFHRQPITYLRKFSLRPLRVRRLPWM